MREVITPDKARLIRAIQAANPTARTAWLAEFEDTALIEYLAHLDLLTGPRGRESTWVRQTHEPAMMTRLPRN